MRITSRKALLRSLLYLFYHKASITIHQEGQKMNWELQLIRLYVYIDHHYHNGKCKIFCAFDFTEEVG